MTDQDNVIVEQAMEEGKEVSAKQPKAPRSSKSLVYGVIAFTLLAALAVGLGVGLSDRKDKSRKSTQASLDENDEPTVDDVPSIATVDDVPSITKIRISDATTRSLSLISGDTLKNTYLDCDDAAVDVRKALLTMADRAIENHANSYYFSDDYVRFPEFGVSMPGVEFADSDMMADGAAAPQGAARSPSVETTEDSYGSNNQVEGVEEPDIVKSDGTDIFTAYGAEIVKVNVASQAVVKRAKLPDDDKDCNTQNILSMLLVDDRLVVFSSGWCQQDVQDDVMVGGGAATSRIIGPPIYGTELTKITIYDKDDLSIIGNPQELQGRYINARAIGDDVYVVTSRSLNTYYFLGLIDPWTIANDKFEGKRMNSTDYKALAQEIAEASVDEFAAKLIEDLECETLQQITLFQNSDVVLPYGPVMESIATVTGFSATNPEATSVTSRVMPTSSWQLYSSESTLVLCAEGYWVADDVESETYVLAYNLANGEVEPLGLGTIPGYLLNQFSIDEHNGYLRFASTIRQRWIWLEDGDAWESEPVGDSDNMIVVLAVPSGGNGDSVLAEVGRLEGLGKPGEMIYSVRFQGDRAFVVTFEQTDPFYTIDMSSPTNPQKVGELEIPGFSNYLHPMGDNHLVGVGQYVEDGMTMGLQISLFDVSDFANPQRVANFVERGGDGSYSDAQYNHQAFRLLGNGLLILPVQVNDWSRWGPDGEGDGQADSEAFDGFKVYYVNNGDAPAVTQYFEISHGSNYYDGCWSPYGYLAARSLVFGGNVWTLKTHTILVHDLTNRVQVGNSAINLDENLSEDECTPNYFPGSPEIFLID